MVMEMIIIIDLAGKFFCGNKIQVMRRQSVIPCGFNNSKFLVNDRYFVIQRSRPPIFESVIILVSYNVH